MLSFTSILFHCLKRPCASSPLSHALTVSPGPFTKEQLRTMASHSPGQLLQMVKSVIPSLEFTMHKGQAGRVAVVGGCKEYTGAPYFAAISALKVGADLSHVFCTSDAATVIKSYSPELIVHPVLDHPQAVREISPWMARFHSLVVGPGLGREQAQMKTTAEIIKLAKNRQIPIVIDADGLHLITEDPSLIAGYQPAILTPNVVEFGRLYRKVFNKDPDPEEPVITTKELCRQLGHVTIVQKGLLDIISNGQHVLVCSQPGSPRRCGGQGDLLSGSMGTFALWASQEMAKASPSALLHVYGPNLCAGYGASLLTRTCSGLAFDLCGRSMTTSDMIQQIRPAFDKLFS